MPIIPESWVLYVPFGTLMILSDLAEHGAVVCFDNPVDETLTIKVSDRKGEVRTFTLTKQMTDNSKIMETLTRELRDMRYHLDTLDFSKHIATDHSVDVSDYVERIIKESFAKSSVSNTLNIPPINVGFVPKAQTIGESLYEAIKNRGDFDIDFDKLVDVLMTLGVLKPKEQE